MDKLEPEADDLSASGSLLIESAFCIFPESGGGNAIEVLEFIGEEALRGKTAFKGNIGYRLVGCDKHFAGALCAVFIYVIEGRLLRNFFEIGAEIFSAHTRFF